MKIKNTTWLLIISFVLISCISAQEKSYTAGVKIGFNIAAWHGDDAEGLEMVFADDPKARFGLGVGGIFALNFGKFFAIQPEIMFTAKGKRFYTKSTEFDPFDSITIIYEATYIFKQTYWEIPVLLKVRIPANERVKPFFYTGITLSFLLGAEMELEMKDEAEGEVLFEGSHETDIKDDIRKFDFGLAFGGGMTIKAGPGSIIADLRYTHQFVNIVKDNTENLFVGDEDIKNLAFSIMTGYVFDF